MIQEAHCADFQGEGHFCFPPLQALLLQVREEAIWECGKEDLWTRFGELPLAGTLQVLLVAVLRILLHLKQLKSLGKSLEVNLQQKGRKLK